MLPLTAAEPGTGCVRQPMQPTRVQFLAAYTGPATHGRWRRLYAGAMLTIFYCMTVPAAALEGAAPGAAAAPAFAPALDQTAALRASQAAMGRTIGDYTLQDTEGRAVRL